MGKLLCKENNVNSLNFLLQLTHISSYNSEDIVLTTGATQGLHLILSTLIDFSGVIFVDEVTYMIALSAMAQFHTMKVVTGELSECIFWNDMRFTYSSSFSSIDKRRS